MRTKEQNNSLHVPPNVSRVLRDWLAGWRALRDASPPLTWLPHCSCTWRAPAALGTALLRWTQGREAREVDEALAEAIVSALGLVPDHAIDRILADRDPHDPAVEWLREYPHTCEELREEWRCTWEWAVAHGLVPPAPDAV